MLYGMFTVNLALAAGATMALLPAFSPPALAEALDQYRPTQAFTAPAHMTACLQANLLNPGAAVVAALSADFRQRLSARTGAGRAGDDAERQGDAALGHERIAGRRL